MEAEAFLRADNEPVPTTIQTNTLKTTAKQLCASLEDEGVTVEPHPWLADCFTVSGTGDLEGLRAWREGWFTVQDAAAKLTALAAAPKAGSFVIDTCAAPGGKSFAMAMCMEGKGHILSCDMEEHKLRLMEAGAERLGIECMEVRLADGRVCEEALAEKADIVICDVPCSGLGIIRKKPDIRYKKADDLFTLPVIQTALLDNAAKFSPEGGTVAVNLRKAKNALMVSVTDQGEGMSADTQAHIFEQFYQGDTSHTTQGNGLGLAMVKKVLELHGGSIQVNSAPGQGSCFTVTLPI